MPDVTPQATPGQAAYEERVRHAAERLKYTPQAEWVVLDDGQRSDWEAAAAAASRVSLARVLAECARYKAERDAAREEAKDWALKAAQACNQRDDALNALFANHRRAAAYEEDVPRHVPDDGEFPDAEEIAGFARDLTEAAP